MGSLRVVALSVDLEVAEAETQSVGAWPDLETVLDDVTVADVEEGGAVWASQGQEPRAIDCVDVGDGALVWRFLATCCVRAVGKTESGSSGCPKAGAFCWSVTGDRVSMRSDLALPGRGSGHLPLRSASRSAAGR